MLAPTASSASVDRACAALLPRLPQQLAGVPGRPTSAPARARAWGDPPITLVCGSATADPDAPPLIVDGLAFSAVERGGTVTWTTRDRTPTVQLVIPSSYADQADLVLPLVPELARLPQLATSG